MPREKSSADAAIKPDEKTGTMINEIADHFRWTKPDVLAYVVGIAYPRIMAEPKAMTPQERIDQARGGNDS